MNTLHLASRCPRQDLMLLSLSVSEERIVVISSSEDSDAENSVSGSEVQPRTPASLHSRSQRPQPQQVTLRLALRLENIPARQ